ncbi:putative LRR receptor-like serine/threonine-protein kinase [Hordeum vulgare]|nr:putative LRR receptor-like serine/threonine-protein kinase [Hordeum vulgare]
MWSSGRGSGSRSGCERDPERERRVRADDARKRGARRWTNRGMSSPTSFNRRETEEYDRRSASFSSARSSYARSSSSSDAGFLPVKREWSDDEEEPEEPKEPALLGRRGVVGPDDYAADFDAVAAAIAERSVREEAEPGATPRSSKPSSGSRRSPPTRRQRSDATSARSRRRRGVDGSNGNDEHVGDLDFDLDISYDEYQQETLDRHWEVMAKTFRSEGEAYMFYNQYAKDRGFSIRRDLKFLEKISKKFYA